MLSVKLKDIIFLYLIIFMFEILRFSILKSTFQKLSRMGMILFWTVKFCSLTQRQEILCLLAPLVFIR